MPKIGQSIATNNKRPDDHFFENDPLDKPKKMPMSKKFYLFRKMVKNAKW